MARAIPQTTPEYDRTRIVERPDGFYWRLRGSSRESGPFDTLVEAVADMEAAGDGDSGPGETLQEAEAELGIADWIDPDTGTPAEERRPRIEDN